jgi:hypothetical protein
MASVTMSAEKFANLTGIDMEDWGLDETIQSVTVFADGTVNALDASGGVLADLAAGNAAAAARVVGAYLAVCEDA